MIPLEEAQARLLALAVPLPLEEVSLSQGLGRVLARPVRAARAQPPFDASAMDGYAVTAQPAAGEWLQVVGSSRAGAAHDGVLQPGQAVRIFTGAPVPEGAARVILQEDVTRDGDRITFTGRAEAGIHIRPRGSDFGQGQLFDAPRRLDGVALSLLAAMGCDRLQVARAPRIAIIPTGDELVLPGSNPGPDQIICTNHLAISAMAQAEGAEVRVLPIAGDTEESLGRMLDLARDADIVITIGGASVGDHDHVARVTAARGMVPVFHKVALRPGKPALAGRMGDQLLIGLPGNPVSAMVCARLFLRPMLRALQGLPQPIERHRIGRLGRDVAANGPRAHYMRASLDPFGADGVPVLTPLDSQDSGLLWQMSGAGALLIRPAGDPARSCGELVHWIPLQDPAAPGG